MGKLDLILQMIKAGVSASKIIAKYGKQAYNAVKKSKAAEKPKTKKIKKDTTDLIGDVVIGGGLAGTAAVIAMMVKEKMQKEKKKKQRTKSRKKQRGMSSGGSVNSRSIARKYFKGGLV